MKRILVATRNINKVQEIADLLNDLDVRVLTLDYVNPGLELPETGDTFMENARQKAVRAAKETGMLTIADDSGLAVDALNGEPGVHSKRFEETDAKRIAKLLEMLKRVPDPERTARFHCAVVIADPDGVIEEIEEKVEGAIIRTPRGTLGFGYDPIFQPTGMTRTMAELALGEKNMISHRGKAFRRAAAFLHEYLQPKDEGESAP